MSDFILFLEKIETLSELERALEQASRGIDVEITKHFLERIKERGISPEEIVSTFKKFIDKYSSKLTTDKKVRVSGVIQNVFTNLNIPVDWNNKGTPTPKDDVISLITVMKKQGFAPNDPNDKVFKVTEASKHSPNTCQVCRIKTKAASNLGMDEQRALILEHPLNKKHFDTYRRGFEFMVKDTVWKVVMPENLYLCMECYEREYLTKLIKNDLNNAKSKFKQDPEALRYINELAKRKPNKFGFYHVSINDFYPSNPVNDGLIEFFQMAANIENQLAKKKENDKYAGMISTKDRINYGAEDDDFGSLDFSDYN